MKMVSPGCCKVGSQSALYCPYRSYGRLITEKGKQHEREGRWAGTIGVLITAPQDTHTHTQTQTHRHTYLHCRGVEEAALKAGCKFLIDLLFATMFY